VTPRAHLVCCATVLALSRGGITSCADQIMALSFGWDLVARPASGDILRPVWDASARVLDARLAGDEMAFGEARYQLATDLSAYWTAQMRRAAT
jgi:hypothetical protein